MDSSRPSALPDWSAVPSDLEEDRRLMNQRLAYFGAVVFVLSSFFLGVSFVTRFALGVPPFTLDAALHGLAQLVFAAEWLLCRKGKRSSKQLNLIDVGSFASAMCLYGVMVALEPQPHLQLAAKAPVNSLLITVITLAIVVTRAVIVPGTARRTSWISAIGCMPAIVVSYYVASQVPLPVGNIPWNPIVNVTYTTAWCVLAVSIATLTSRVIYGLSQKVRKATELGQYTLEEKIGEGGMGAVYRARHAFLRRPTAVKLLPLDRAGQRSIERFEREVQLTSALTHPNTIAIYDFGHTPDGVFYYAMEYLGEGITLEDLVTHDGPQPPARVIHMLKQLCGALHEAHTAGLIHRDVKPANVVLCERGGVSDYVKVLDFGLVKDTSEKSPALSAEQTIMGTPMYMAPEAILDPNRIDARADIYAVGAVGYELLTGAPVFTGATMVEVLAKHLHERPVSPSERAGKPLPAALEALVLSCLAKQPVERPASAAEIVDALDGENAGKAWTAHDAQRWWRERASKIVAATKVSRSSGDAIAHGKTIAVDLAGRR